MGLAGRPIIGVHARGGRRNGVRALVCTGLVVNPGLGDTSGIDAHITTLPGMIMNINWKKDSFANEEAEFDRVATELTKGQDDKAWDRAFEKLKVTYRNAKLTKLSEAVWARLENTDSHKVKTMKDIMRAISDNSGGSGTRDIYKVIKEVVSGVCRAPIVLKHNGKYTLVAGNTRLMAARLLGIVPNVVLLSI